MPEPFLVMATQNPIETGGHLSAARGAGRPLHDEGGGRYPTEEEEFVIVDRVTGIPNDVVSMATTEQLSVLQHECRSLYVDPSLKQYAVRLASATRDPDRYGVSGLAKYVSFGASPRASINLIEGARALAFLRGRTYVLPEDVRDLVPDVFRHRLVLTYEALAEGMTADQLIHRIMQQISAPEKPPETHVKVQPARSEVFFPRDSDRVANPREQAYRSRVQCSKTGPEQRRRISRYASRHGPENMEP